MRSRSMLLAFLVLAACESKHSGANKVGSTRDCLAIPKDTLRDLLPWRLGQLHRRGDFFAGEDPCVVEGVYEASTEGPFASLAIASSPRIEDTRSLLDCQRREEIRGFAACVTVQTMRDNPYPTASIRWQLTNGLFVSISATTEALVRAIALELPLTELAKLAPAA